MLQKAKSSSEFFEKFRKFQEFTWRNEKSRFRALKPEIP